MSPAEAQSAAALLEDFFAPLRLCGRLLGQTFTTNCARCWRRASPPINSRRVGPMCCACNFGKRFTTCKFCQFLALVRSGTFQKKETLAGNVGRLKGAGMT